MTACPEEAATVRAAINAEANAGEIAALKAKIASREGLIRSLVADLYRAKAEARARRERCAELEDNHAWRKCA